MNVYIIKTPEYDVYSYREVIRMLNSVPGTINFIGTTFEFNVNDQYFLEYELYPNHPFQYPDNLTKIKFQLGLNDPRSWSELFILCNSFRQRFGIDDEDFVVLLTDRKNATNWFSTSDKLKNIFVVTSEWEEYTTLPREFPIVHQIIENIFQVLMGIDVRGESPYIHEILKGCINDFCEDKYQVIAKLKSGSICEDCIKEIREKISDIQIAKHLKKYLNLVRDAYDIDFFDLPITNLSSISLKKNRNSKRNELIFHTYNKTLTLYPLEMTLYIFYLKFGGDLGVKLRDLKDETNKAKLVEIYKSISTNIDQKSAEFTIEGLVTRYYSVHKSNLETKIMSAILNDNISQNYIISGQTRGRQKILIPRDQVSIHY